MRVLSLQSKNLLKDLQRRGVYGTPEKVGTVGRIGTLFVQMEVPGILGKMSKWSRELRS